MGYYPNATLEEEIISLLNKRRPVLAMKLLIADMPWPWKTNRYGGDDNVFAIARSILMKISIAKKTPPLIP